MRKGSTVAAQEETTVKVFGPVLADTDGKTTPEYDKAFAALSEDIRKAIADGHVVASVSQVRRKDGQMDYIKLQAVDADGMPTIEDGNLEPVFEGEGDDRKDLTDGRNVVNSFNYGSDLKRRNALTQRLATLMEGPDKALEKAAENIAKAFGITIEQAREKVKSLGNV